MKIITAILIALLAISQSGFSQDNRIKIPVNALESNSDLGKFCDLISKKENLNRKIIYNLASNGIIARSIQNNNLEYTQVRYNHMLLKLFSDAYFNCKDFRENSHYVFDAENSENTQLVSQHKDFGSSLVKYIEKDKILIKLTDSQLAIIGYVEHVSDNHYTLSFYQYSPENGTVVPNKLTNRFANYNFELDGENIVLIDKDINEETLQKLLSQKSKKAPPPPPMSKQK